MRYFWRIYYLINPVNDKFNKSKLLIKYARENGLKFYKMKLKGFENEN